MSVLPARGTPLWVLALWALPFVLPTRGSRVAGALVAAGALAFFRDPERSPEGGGLVAAGDGLIRDVSRSGDGRWVVSTYLSLRDVHVTRAPAEGTVVAQDYRAGAHHAAFDRRARTNERLSWRFDTSYGPMDLVQYSGAVARRIVPYASVGARVGRGDRIGLIRFGSRIDVTLPEGVAPAVKVGARVSAGRTCIGEVARESGDPGVSAVPGADS